MSASGSTHLIAMGGRSFVSWLTGTGFLMLDGALFFLSLSFLIPWNLYTDPGDFWVADPLRKWAFLLAFHALLVGAWSVAHHLLWPSDEEPIQNRSLTSGWRSSVNPPQPSYGSQTNSRQTTSDLTASSLLAEEWARRWLDSESNDLTMNPPSEGSQFDNPASASMNRYPIRPETRGNVWPDHAPRSDSGSDEPRQFRSEPDDMADLTHTSDQSGRDSLDPLHTAARASASNGANPGDESEADWRWIEAAANAWLSRREQESSDDTSRE